MSSDLQFKIYEDFLHYFLPDGLLDFFDPVMAEQKTHINPTTKAQGEEESNEVRYGEP